MRRALAIIAIVGVLGLIALLVYRAIMAEDDSPRFEDRLPMAEVIGRTDILNLAKDFIPATYNNQISFREFISPEFILSQGKINGLNLQRPIYFFGNHKNTEISKWGLMIHVSDSSKVLPGIKRFEKITELKDSTLFNQRIFIFPEYDLAIGYGEDWLLIAERRAFKKYLDHVVHSRVKSIYPRWREFIKERLFREKPLQASVVSSELKKYGISAAFMATSSDSMSVTLHTRLTNLDTIPFTLKQTGERFERSEFTRRMINVHLDTDRLKGKKNDQLYK